MEKQQKINFGLGWIAEKINFGLGWMAEKIKTARASRNTQKQKDTYSDGSHFTLLNQASILRSLR